jgi:hypothetical protein
MTEVPNVPIPGDGIGRMLGRATCTPEVASDDVAEERDRTAMTRRSLHIGALAAAALAVFYVAVVPRV